MMKSKLMLFAVAVLSGCAGAPTKPEPPEMVDKVVAVGCLGTQPVMPVDAFQTGSNAGPWPGDKAAAQAALVDREAWKQYAQMLLAAQAGCDRK